jgi:hypothetical protein
MGVAGLLEALAVEAEEVVWPGKVRGAAIFCYASSALATEAALAALAALRWRACTMRVLGLLGLSARPIIVTRHAGVHRSSPLAPL